MTEHDRNTIAGTARHSITGDHSGDRNSHWRILGPQCASALDQLRAYEAYRLEEFRQAEERPKELESAIDAKERLEALAVDDSVITSAATEILACVQRELRGRAGTRLDPRDAAELWRARRYALDALITIKNARYAKETEARVAGEYPPVTVCIGSRKRRWLKTELDVMEVGVMGCGRVFEDAPYQTGEMWLGWCPDCRNDTARPIRDQERAVVTAVARWRRGDDSPLVRPTTRAERRLRDSSKTRVEPLFTQLLERDPTGASWLSDLLRLPRPPGQTVTVGVPGLLEVAEFEARLEPPRALLEWLIENPTDTAPPNYGTRSETVREKRMALCDGDTAIRKQALRELARSGFKERAWYVFEGATFVDLYLETAQMIVLIEGKRTERQPTTNTDWMPVRDQMLRTLDAAWNNRGQRQLVAMYIVGENDTAEPSPSWKRAITHTISPKVLDASLPHRSPDVRKRISQCFLGVTTWGRACETLSVDYGSLPDKL
jgi:hypothetical protein